MSTSTFTRVFDFFGPTSDFRSPLWLFRICPVVCLLCVVLSATVWQSGFAHGLCLGLALAQLVSLAQAGFQVTSLNYRNSEQPSDVQDLHITR